MAILNPEDQCCSTPLQDRPVGQDFGPGYHACAVAESEIDWLVRTSREAQRGVLRANEECRTLRRMLERALDAENVAEKRLSVCRNNLDSYIRRSAERDVP